jgi:ABC-type transport system involved in cytochrome c biogenesis ATPase subunit
MLDQLGAWEVVRNAPKPLFWRVCASAAVFLLMRLAVLLMLHAAINYDPTANPALLAFLFINVVVFEAVAYRIVLDSLQRVSEARLASPPPGVDMVAWSETLRHVMRQLATRVSGAMVLLLIGTYVFLLSPLAALIMVLVVVGAQAVGMLLGAPVRRDHLAVKHAGLAVPDPGVPTGFDAAALWATYTASLGQAARSADNRLAIQAAIGLIGAGFVAIAAPLLAGPDPATVARIAVSAVVLWAMTLFIPAWHAAPSASKPASRHPVTVREVPAMPLGLPALIGLTAFSNFTDIQIRFPPATVLLIFGDNASGKSALLARLAGHGPDWAGILQIGSDLALIGKPAADALRGMTALVVEAPALPDFVVQPESRFAMAAMLPLAGLPPVMLDEHGVLHSQKASRTQQTRVALALGMLARRPVLLLDGFLNGQDDDFRRHFQAETLPYLRSTGCCVVLSSHDPGILPDADSRFRLRDGQLVDA